MRGNVDEIGDLRELDLVRLYEEETGETTSIDTVKRGFRQDMQFYRDLVRTTGFVELGRVIDLGCGVGRFAFPLAEVNDYVLGVDLYPENVLVAKKLAEMFEIDNVEFVTGSIETTLPAEENSLQGAWCYVTLMLVDRGRVFKELSRVLVPGGRVFVGGHNSVGKLLEKMCEGYLAGGLEHYRFRNWSRALERGPFADGPQNYITEATLTEIAAAHGYALDESFPIETGKRTTLTDEEKAIFEDPARLVARFREEPKFRDYMLESYKRLRQGVDFNLDYVVTLARK